MKSRRNLKDLLHYMDEKPILENLYLYFSVATDQLRRDPLTLQKITNAFNTMTGQDYSPSLLLRYMINRRKQSDWPKLGAQAKKFPATKELLTDHQLSILKQIYMDIDTPSDEYQFSKDVVYKLERRFKGLSGMNIGGHILVSIIIAKRKRGKWIKIRTAFSDFDRISETA